MRSYIVWGVRRRFHRLSPGHGHVAHALRTLAPVAAKCITTSALPLDLHVLSLPLAFILSQDQTLLCIYTYITLSPIPTGFLKKRNQRSRILVTISRYLLVLTSVLSMNLSKNPIRLANGIAKVSRFFKTANFLKKIFKIFSVSLGSSKSLLEAPRYVIYPYTDC